MSTLRTKHRNLQWYSTFQKLVMKIFSFCASACPCLLLFFLTFMLCNVNLGSFPPFVCKSGVFTPFCVCEACASWMAEACVKKKLFVQSELLQPKKKRFYNCWD
jgi:hypothetical protein